MKIKASVLGVGLRVWIYPYMHFWIFCQIDVVNIWGGQGDHCPKNMKHIFTWNTWNTRKKCSHNAGKALAKHPLLFSLKTKDEESMICTWGSPLWHNCDAIYVNITPQSSHNSFALANHPPSCSRWSSMMMIDDTYVHTCSHIHIQLRMAKHPPLVLGEDQRQFWRRAMFTWRLQRESFHRPTCTSPQNPPHTRPQTSSSPQCQNAPQLKTLLNPQTPLLNRAPTPTCTYWT